MALEIRVVAPTGLAGSVVEMARTHPGVAGVSRIEGASVVPAGDVVTIQAVREATDDLLARLHELGIARDGSVTVTAPELVISERMEQADAAMPVDGADAIIWDEVAQNTSADSKLTWSFLAFMVIAVQLAGIGIVTDSTIAIVGAMVVGPDFGPLAGLALALVDRKWALARRSGAALLVGFPAAMVVTAVGTWLSMQAGLFDPAALSGPNSATDFIYHPGPYSFIVALLAGAAGMLSLIGRRSAVLVGVFISVTTVPAAGYVAVAWVIGAPGRAAGSALQLVFNVAGIVLAAAVVLLVYRLFRRRRPAPAQYSPPAAKLAIPRLGHHNPFRR